MRFVSKHFLDNPLIGRQLATHFTGMRLGAEFFVFTGALLLADAITFLTVLLARPSGLVAEEAGLILWSVNSLVLLGLLVVTIPLRLAGAIDGPRRDKVFDQVVVTGVSPLTIQFGNWTLAWLYTLGVLCISLPFQVYAYMLGGVSWEQLLGGYAILAIYVNLIIAVALGLATFEREWIAVPATIAIFLGLGLINLGPIPGEIGLSTPLRYFLRPLMESQWVLRYWDVDPVFYLWSLHPAVHAPLLWICLAAPGLVLVLLGPSHRFQPGLNNFGNVVLSGDRKRRLFRRVRPTLTRRVELAFFYENRPRWLQGIDYPLRAFLGVGSVLFALGLIVGLVFRGVPHFRDRLVLVRDPAWVVAILTTAAVLFVAVLLFGDAGSRRAWREQVGKWQIPRGILQGACVLALLAAYFALHRHLLAAGLAAYTAGANAPPNWEEKLASVARDHQELVLALTLFLGNWFLLGRLLASLVSSQVALRLILLLAGGAVLCGPLLLAVGMEERWLSRDNFGALFLTPLSVFLVRGGDLFEFARLLPADFNVNDAFGYYLQWHGTLAVTIVVLLVLVFLARLLRHHQRKQKLRAGAIALVLLGSIAADSRLLAQEGALPLEMRLVHGFEGRLFQQNFDCSADFFTLTLKNNALTEVRGELRLEHASGEVAWTRPLLLPAGTTLPVRWVERTGSGGAGYLAGSSLVIDVAGELARLQIDAPFYLQRNAPEECRFQLFVAATDVSASSLPRGPNDKDQWAVATYHCLPEEAYAYALLDGIHLQQPDFSRWTSGQRRALHDYLRLGGCVVVSGALDPGRLKGSDEWESLLKSRRSLRASVDGVEVVVETLEDSWVASALGGEAGKGSWGDSLPLLGVRPVGLGRLCHLGIDPSGPRLGQKIWRELWGKALPRSGFPAGAFHVFASEVELRDSTSLLVVFGYFVAYSCVLGPLGLVTLRRRSRRQWIPVWILGLPLLFVALLPALHASLHLRPSLATLTRVELFGTGARRGVAYERLQVRSSGRQDHALVLKGAIPAAFLGGDSDGHPGGRSPASFDLVPVPLRRGAGEEFTCNVRTPPWGGAQLMIVTDAECAEPIGGRATVNKTAQTMELVLNGFDGQKTAGAGLVLLRLAGDPRASRALVVPPETLRGGTVRVNYGSDSVAARLTQAMDRSTSQLGQILLRGLPDRDAVYVGWELDAASRGVHSRDLAFEREETSNSGDKKHRSFVRSVVLVELPLEVK